MKVFFTGGTGLIRSTCTNLAVRRRMDLTIPNRVKSGKYSVPASARLLTADVHGDAALLASALLVSPGR